MNRESKVRNVSQQRNFYLAFFVPQAHRGAPGNVHDAISRQARILKRRKSNKIPFTGRPLRKILHRESTNKHATRRDHHQWLIAAKNFLAHRPRRYKVLPDRRIAGRKFLVNRGDLSRRSVNENRKLVCYAGFEQQLKNLNGAPDGQRGKQNLPITSERCKQGLTQDELARKSDLPYTTLT